MRRHEKICLFMADYLLIKALLISIHSFLFDVNALFLKDEEKLRQGNYFGFDACLYIS